MNSSPLHLTPGVLLGVAWKTTVQQNLSRSLSHNVLHVSYASQAAAVTDGNDVPTPGLMAPICYPPIESFCTCHV